MRGRESSIIELQDDDGGVAHKTPCAMLDVAATFCDHLFRAESTTPEYEEVIFDSLTSTLNDDDRQSVDAPLSLEECRSIHEVEQVT